MAETVAVPRRTPQPPPAAAVARPAPTNPAVSGDQRFRTVQLILFTGGAILMPLGIVAILLGWYGTAHTKYQYDQLPYVVSGGLLGLGLVFLGGFLYFGAWLARSANEQRESARELAEAVRALAEQLGRPSAANGGGPRAGNGIPLVGGALTSAPGADHGDGLVLAGAGSTIHRSDCALIAHRQDLRPLTGAEPGLGTCRVCRPSIGN